MKRTRAGFTLIEILVALVVVSVGLTAALSRFGAALTALDDTRDRLIGDRLLQEQWAALEAEIVWSPESAPMTARGVFAPPDQAFEWERLVVPVPMDETEQTEEEPRGRLYEVDIRVRRIGATRGSLSARSLVAAGPFPRPDDP